MLLRYHPTETNPQAKFIPSFPLSRPGIHDREEDIIRPKPIFVLSVHRTIKTIAAVFTVLIFAPTIPFALTEPESYRVNTILGVIWEEWLYTLMLILLPVQYIPQIRKTYMLKRPESLSIITVSIQTGV